MAQGLEYLHRVGVVHRDIKSLNILLGADRSTGERRAKICDLGSAILLSTLASFLTLIRVYGSYRNYAHLFRRRLA